jgi:hypothetical protein
VNKGENGHLCLLLDHGFLSFVHGFGPQLLFLGALRLSSLRYRKENKAVVCLPP